jgi:hypothetical protein
MSEFLAAVAGGALVGVFTVMTTIIQQRHATEQSAIQHERERQLAAEEHAREATAAENKELSTRLDKQLAWGDTVTRAVWRVTEQMRGIIDETQRYGILSQTVKMFGLDFNQFSEASRLLPPEFFEDDALKQLVRRHRDWVFRLEWAFILADGHPDGLPADPEAECRGVADLKLEIEMLRRDLLRTGRPL